MSNIRSIRQTEWIHTRHQILIVCGTRILYRAFHLCAVAFGGRQGLRGLIALGLGFLAIAYILLPGILHGFSPIVLSMLVASLIVIVGSYITHGWNKVTTAAVIGMIATILLTSGLAYTAIHFGKLTGLGTEEAVYLNFDTGGHINFAELLAGGILIGLLGILYDAAIGQAAAVDELRKAAAASFAWRYF